MGNVLTHDIVIPEVWYLNFHKEQIIDGIQEQLMRLRNEKLKYDGAVITIGDTCTILRIHSPELYWWFSLPGDYTEPDARKYIFSGNLLSQYFPDLMPMNEVHERRRHLMWAEDHVRYDKYHDDFDDDEGVYMGDVEFSSFVDIDEDFLRYDAIIPKVWLNRLNLGTIASIVDSELFNNYDIQYDKITVSVMGIVSRIIINNEHKYWWFKLPQHTEPNIWDYHFTGTLLSEKFPNLFKELTILKLPMNKL